MFHPIGGPKLPTPDRIYTISSKRMYDSCPKKYEFRYRMGLDAAELSKPFAEGMAFHADAEQVHSGEIEDLSLGGEGYDKWVQDWEEFDAHKVEHALMVPLTALQDYIGDTSTPLEGHFGGVVDMVGTNRKDNSIWILDHKSVSRFYDYPRLFSTEQVGMYLVAWRLQNGGDLAGGCISRVRIKPDAHPKYYTNYVLKYLKDKDISLGVILLRRIIRTIRILAKGIKGKGRKALSTVEPTPGKVVLTLKELPKKGHVNILGVTERNEKGYLTLSIQYKRGSMLHIERHFYELSEEELKEIVRDFLAYVRKVQTEEYYRRAPGLQCGRCPFQMLCEATRKSYVAFWEGDLGDWGLTTIKPNEEVLRALKKGEEIT